MALNFADGLGKISVHTVRLGFIFLLFPLAVAGYNFPVFKEEITKFFSNRVAFYDLFLLSGNKKCADVLNKTPWRFNLNAKAFSLE